MRMIDKLAESVDEEIDRRGSEEVEDGATVPVALVTETSARKPMCATDASRAAIKDS